MTDDLIIQGRRGFRLRLSSEGLTIRYVWRTSHFAWTDIDGEFRPVWRYVAFDLTPRARRANKPRAAYTWVQRTLFRFDAAIDPAPYRLAQNELLKMLNERRSALHRTP